MIGAYIAELYLGGQSESKENKIGMLLPGGNGMLGETNETDKLTIASRANVLRAHWEEEREKDGHYKGQHYLQGGDISVKQLYWVYH